MPQLHEQMHIKDSGLPFVERKGMSASLSEMLAEKKNNVTPMSMASRKEAAREAFEKIKRPPPLTPLSPQKTISRAVNSVTKNYYGLMRLLGYLGSAVDKKMDIERRQKTLQ